MATDYAVKPVSNEPAPTSERGRLFRFLFVHEIDQYPKAGGRTGYRGNHHAAESPGAVGCLGSRVRAAQVAGRSIREGTDNAIMAAAICLVS